MDSKRRLLVPQDYRAAALTAHSDVEPFEGLYGIKAINAPCLECGGAALFATYRDVIEEYPKLSPTRLALQRRFYGEMQKLAFDTAGRITLPEKLCQAYGLTGDVMLVGLGQSFQIWEPKAYEAWAQAQDKLVEDAVAQREVMHA